MPFSKKRAHGLTAQRIWQDLTEEFGHGHSYESVKRYLRTIAPRARGVGVFESAPGAEGQVDFVSRGADPRYDDGPGRWEGNVLVVETSHLKAGWMRRNGLALSDRATMTERFFRHGDIQTHTCIIEDPVYLSEPLIKTNGFRLTTNTAMQPYPCQPAVEVDRDPGDVPHHLPGQNPYIAEFAKKYNLPIGAALGGASTALPEFAKTLGTVPRREAGRPTASSRPPVRV